MQLDITTPLPTQIRLRILDIAKKAESAHIACAFSLVEILCAIYCDMLKLEDTPRPFSSTNRDFCILSKGHGAMALYAIFERNGWLATTDLDKYFEDGSLLHGLVEPHVPGFEVCSGSLGHGLPIATGIALGLKQRNSPHNVYCVVGDGEMNEGTMWESLLFASHHKLDNLAVIVDANGYQAMGPVQEILQTDSLVDKFYAFGFRSQECDGHSITAITKTISDLRNTAKPIAVVAKTVKGKGVTFMEHNNEWHYRRLSESLYEQARSQLSSDE